ncbi:MAG: CBS domain-containing protein [Chloroflexota bacterium]|nr:CBS domain-containing protein [Chloroflexota bacterium]
MIESESRRGMDRRSDDISIPIMTAADVMRPVPTITADISWRGALQLLLGNTLDAAPVVDGERRVIGIITQTDLATRTSGTERTELRAVLDGVLTIRSHRTLLRWHESPHWEMGSTVATLMTTPVVTVRPETPLSTVARILLDHDIAQIPITDADGQVRGMVRQRDIVAAVAMWSASLLPPAERDAFAAWAAS